MLFVVVVMPSIKLIAQQEIQLDSLALAIDTIGFPVTKMDTVRQKIETPVDSVSKIVATLQSETDPTIISFDGLGAKIDSLKIRYRTRKDSLASAGLSTKMIDKKLDSLNHLDVGAAWEKTNNKINSAESKVAGVTSKPASAVNNTLNKFNGEAEGKATLSGPVDTPSAGIPNINLNQPGLEVPQGDIEIDKPDVVLDVPGGKLPKEIELKQSEGARAELGKVSEAAGTVKDFGSDLPTGKSINQDAVGKSSEKLASEIAGEDLQELKTGETQVTEAFDNVQSFRDPEAFKKHTLDRGRQEVVKQLAGQSAAVTSAVDKISKYQKAGGGIGRKVKGLPENRTKKESLPPIERFVPGLTFQVQKKDLLAIDVNTSLRYRFNTIFSFGVGWVDRLSFRDGEYTPENRVYGVRTLGEGALIKRFSVRLDVERLNALVAPSVFQPDLASRQWNTYLLGGLKKDFKLFDGINGNVQFMYNFTHRDGTSPYFNRFNVRFGIEFPMRKNAKAELSE